MTQRAQRQVRDVISPADSAKMVGYASEILDIPKEDIAKAYSEGVAGVPAIRHPGMFSARGNVGEWTYSPEKKLKFDQTYEPSFAGKKEWGESMWRTYENSILHEAFGHGLLQSLYGHHLPQTPFVREETFPYLMQTMSSRGTKGENRKLESILYSKALKEKQLFEKRVKK